MATAIRVLEFASYNATLSVIHEPHDLDRELIQPIHSMNLHRLRDSRTFVPYFSAFSISATGIAPSRIIFQAPPWT